MSGTPKYWIPQVYIQIYIQVYILVTHSYKKKWVTTTNNFSQCTEQSWIRCVISVGLITTEKTTITQDIYYFE